MTDEVKSETVILCEGYHDRAFWSGWLRLLGCQSEADLRAGSGPILDPWGERVEKGIFAFRSRSGKFIRLVPTGGNSPQFRIARALLRKRADRLLNRLVINRDVDVAAPVSPEGPTISDVLAALTPEPASTHLDGDELVFDDTGTRVSFVKWFAGDVSSPGLPEQQCLERLVCAALSAAHPERGACVQAWLDSRNSPPLESVKAYSWSHMAGWYPDHGCEAFYSQLWSEPDIAAELRQRLESSGAWRIADNVAE